MDQVCGIDGASSRVTSQFESDESFPRAVPQPQLEMEELQHLMGSLPSSLEPEMYWYDDISSWNLSDAFGLADEEDPGWDLLTLSEPLPVETCPDIQDEQENLIFYYQMFI